MNKIDKRLKGDIMGWVSCDDNNNPNVIKPSFINEWTSAAGGLSKNINSSSKRGKTNAKWICNQMTSFREGYEKLSGYGFSDAYIECILSLATAEYILSLATTGVEFIRISDVRKISILYP